MRHVRVSVSLFFSTSPRKLEEGPYLSSLFCIPDNYLTLLKSQGLKRPDSGHLT